MTDAKIKIGKLSIFRSQAANANGHTERGLGELSKAFSEVGYVAPMTSAANGEMLDGSARLETASTQFADEALVIHHDGKRPIVMVRDDIPDADSPIAKRISYGANRIFELDLNWTPEQVAADLAAGVNFDGLFTADEQAEILGKIEQPKQEDVEPQIDRVEELRQEWGTELGQLWALGDHRLICGDCTDKAVAERVMGGELADLGVTSPPYAIGKEYEIGVSFDDHLKLLRGMADRSLDTIKPGGFFFVNFDEIAPQSHTKPLTGSNRQCIYPISRDYWQIFHVERKMDLYAQRIWYKPFNRLRQPFWTYHTSIPHHQEWEHIWTWRLPGGDSDKVCDWDISVRAVWDTRDESTDDKPLTRHIAAFPVGIPERAIKAHSQLTDIVWDPFLGSGTTLIACQQLGRRCRGIEIDPSYVAVTLQRYFDMTGDRPQLSNL